jgi:CheY-like chemotaxis protein
MLPLGDDDAIKAAELANELASISPRGAGRDEPSTVKGRVMGAYKLSDAAPKLLIADDDAIIVRSLVERCRWMGFDVETSRSGRSALIRLGQRRPNLWMSDLNGRWPQFLDRQRPSLHVVMIRAQSASTTADCVEKLETSHILKGGDFWSKFDGVLTEVFSLRKEAVRKSATTNLVINLPQVLLVDDDLNVRKFIFAGLRKIGIEPSFATDGILGFWKAKRSKPAVIVSDYFMPNGDAEYLLARLRSTPETQNIPVIVQSGRKLSDAIRQRLQREVCGHPGASLILKKSSGAAELFEILETMCGLAKTALQMEGARAQDA